VGSLVHIKSARFAAPGRLQILQGLARVAALELDSGAKLAQVILSTKLPGEVCFARSTTIRAWLLSTERATDKA
jgi:hypothetical protein